VNQHRIIFIKDKNSLRKEKEMEKFDFEIVEIPSYKAVGLK